MYLYKYIHIFSKVSMGSGFLVLEQIAGHSSGRGSPAPAVPERGQGEAHIDAKKSKPKH